MPQSKGSDAGEILCRSVAILLLATTFTLIYALLFSHKSAATGDVRDLADTDIVADPHVPLDPSRNVIWCGAMALGWNEAIAKFNGPLIFNPQILLADVLNRQEFTKSDLDSDSYVVMSGFKTDNVNEKFREELNRKFGDAARPPALDNDDSTTTKDDVAIYAYLLKNLLFPTPFNNDQQLRFRGAKVASFGFGFEKFASSEASNDLTSEVRLLDYQSEDDFIIELKTKSAGDQMFLAKIPPEKSLEETISVVLAKLDSKIVWGIDNRDKLAIPKIDFDLTKHFKDFEGKHVPGARLTTVAENIVFKLNEKGAELKSFTTINEVLDDVANPPKPIDLVFDKPFLVLLKRESSPRPYFAMWVGNPTLLVAP